jgi:DNA polymerase-3 subunit delta'
MRFSEIPGLNEIKETLIHSVQNNHVAHAQLFAGPKGSGVLPLALAYATYVNCTNKTAEDSCGECASCNKYNKLIHPDLMISFPVAKTKKVDSAASENFMNEWRSLFLQNPFISFHDWLETFDGENKQLRINVEESRSIIKRISLKSFEAEYKVVIIWLPEYMGVEASNALLKVLEEPPVKTLFILATEQQEQLLGTILSRTQRVQVRPFLEHEIVSYLVHNKNLSEQESLKIAYLADGSINQAIELINTGENDLQELVHQWLRVCYQGKVPEMISMADKFSDESREAQKQMLNYALQVCRDGLVYKMAGKDLLRVNESEDSMVINFSKVLSYDKVTKIDKLINEAIAEITRNIASKVVVLDTSLHLFNVLRSE